MKRSFLLQTTRRVSFRRWGNKSFCAFASLKALIKVSVISVSYSLLVMPKVADAQTDSLVIKSNVEIDEVTISSSQPASTYSERLRAVVVLNKDDFEHQPVSNLHELLRNIASVDIRQRGGHGVQADLMVRGGSFDQVTILLNGVNITDPQTGHHNLNIPIDLESVERIELLQGPGARIYGPGSFSGAINIITSTNKSKQAKISATTGQFGLLKTRASASATSKRSTFFVAASSGKSNGYQPNTDFNTHNIFTHGKIKLAQGNIDIQAGYQDKSFGANSFYTPKFPEQFEQTQTFFSSVGILQTVSSVKLSANAYIRQHNDRFELFRNQSPDWYMGHNYHKSIVSGGKLLASSLYKLGRTRIGSEFRNEQIYSNVLGSLMHSPKPINAFTDTSYTKGATRQAVNLFTDHTVYLNSTSASAGINLTFSDAFGFSSNYGLDLNQRIAKCLSFYASVSNAIRFPTFTDMYYSGPTNEGNIDLKPEKANNFEVGIKFNTHKISASVVGFYRQATDVIDWVKNLEDEKWRTMNHTQINTKGTDVMVAINKFDKLPSIKSLMLNYAFLHSDKEADELQSYYALDYLKHKFTANVNHNIYKTIGASWTIILQDRAGGYTSYPENIETPYPTVTMLNVRLYAKHNCFETSLDIHNLFNKPFVDIGNITQPGRWISASFSVTIK